MKFDINILMENSMFFMYKIILPYAEYSGLKTTEIYIVFLTFLLVFYSFIFKKSLDLHFRFLILISLLLFIILIYSVYSRRNVSLFNEPYYKEIFEDRLSETENINLKSIYKKVNLFNTYNKEDVVSTENRNN